MDHGHDHLAPRPAKGCKKIHRFKPVGVAILKDSGNLIASGYNQYNPSGYNQYNQWVLFVHKTSGYKQASNHHAGANDRMAMVDRT